MSQDVKGEARLGNLTLYTSNSSVLTHLEWQLNTVLLVMRLTLH
jgi:hypothetical protein